MNEKIEKFIARNQKRNSHLYEPGMIEGHDYVICPVSQARLSMIKNNYIINVLGMSVDEYPKINRICEKRKQNIKVGLQKIDPVANITNYEKGQIKARKILRQTDENGVSGYKKKGQKTRSTHMNKIDELGRNGYSRIASKAIIKGNLTKAEKGIITHPSNRNSYYRYKILVLHLTNRHRQALTEGYVTGLAGKPGAWHIDHKFSIIQGFREQISPFVIGHRENLQMLPWKQNIQKLHRCDISKEELFRITRYDPYKSQIEFGIISQMIQNDINQEISPNAAYLLERFYESDIR